MDQKVSEFSDYSKFREFDESLKHVLTKIAIKRAPTCHLPARDEDATSAQVRDRIFKLTQNLLNTVEKQIRNKNIFG